MKFKKVKLKNNQVTADYTERFVEANYKNEVTKSSQQFVHPDLLYAMSLLKTHAVKICEMQEAGVVNIENPSDDDLNEKLKNIVVTGGIAKVDQTNRPVFLSRHKAIEKRTSP